jgi:hypothetical protein
MSHEGDHPPVAEAAASRVALVDAHVHFHPAFDERLFFSAAARNFAAAARDLRLDEGWEAILVLTEIAGRDYFAELRGRASPDGRAPVDGPTVRATREVGSVRVGRTEGGEPITVIGGRQIQTSEGLEVLAFPLGDEVPDGLAIRSVLAAVTERQATAVIPWGPGKWSLRRGRILRELLRERRSGERRFLLADTGHRPAWAPAPALLRATGEGGGPQLTGSDPLPLWGEASRAGSCCFEIALEGSSSEPCRALQRALEASEDELRRVERRPGLLRFALAQAAMQARKRLRA